MGKEISERASVHSANDEQSQVRGLADFKAHALCSLYGLQYPDRYSKESNQVTDLAEALIYYYLHRFLFSTPLYQISSYCLLK